MCVCVCMCAWSLERSSSTYSSSSGHPFIRSFQEGEQNAKDHNTEIQDNGPLTFLNKSFDFIVRLCVQECSEQSIKPDNEKH